jgi:enoyl-CoA hydratase
MDGEGEVRVETRDGPGGGRVAFVSIAAGHRLNLLNPALMRRFAEAMAAVSGDAGLHAVVLAGAAGRPFVGGADIREMAALRDEAGARAFIELVHGCCRAVRDCPVPVVARIEGFALGAGLELAAACDLRIAAADARFGMPEVRVGIPSVVEAALLPALIGWGRARRLLLLGEMIGAAEALEWGLVERVAPASGLDAAVAEWLGHLGAAGPLALRSQKALMREWENLPTDRAIAAGIDAFAASWRSDEPVRMLRRFLDRPRPGAAGGKT